MTFSQNSKGQMIAIFCKLRIWTYLNKNANIWGKIWDFFFHFLTDHGVLISTSVIQWVLEVFNVAIYLAYIHFIHGYSNFLDKFFGLYLMVFNMVIQPSFYLNGDASFRRELTNNGFLRAMKWALFE